VITLMISTCRCGYFPRTALAASSASAISVSAPKSQRHNLLPGQAFPRGVHQHVYSVITHRHHSLSNKLMFCFFFILRPLSCVERTARQISTVRPPPVPVSSAHVGFPYLPRSQMKVKPQHPGVSSRGDDLDGFLVMTLFVPP